MATKKVILLSEVPSGENTSAEEGFDVPEEELVPLAAEEIGAAVPQSTKLQEAMSALWATAEPEKSVSSPAPQVVILAVPPMPLVEKLQEDEIRYLKDFGIYDRRAQWQGQPPKDDEPFFQILCVGQGCRKPTWTRRELEDVCEECYLTIQRMLDVGHQQNIGQWNTYSGKIGWIQS